MRNKKGFIATGPTTVMMYLGVFSLIIVFFFIFNLTKEDTQVKISWHITNVDKNLQLLNYMRSHVDVDGTQMNVAELIALSNIDSTRKVILDQKLIEFMDSSYSTCAKICVNEEKLVSNSCISSKIDHLCPVDYIVIPGYDNQLIKIYLEPDSKSLTSQIYKSRYYIRE